MPSRLILSVQNYLTIRGFKPGPLDGEIGDQTVASWNRFLDSEEERLNPLEASSSGLQAPRAQAVTPAPVFSQSILEAALADVGKLSTKNDAGTDHGNVGCADAVTRILHDQLGQPIEKTLSTDELYDELRKSGWREVSTSTPGAVIISPTCSAMHGHTGIIGDDGKIYSNSSATGLWTQNFTVARWLSYYARCGSHAFVPPEDNAPPARTTPSIPTPSGSNSQTSVTGRATIFGLNYDGSMDAGDHGIGAWGTHTANKELIGVSLPEGVMVSTFGFEGTWRQDAAKVGRFLTEKKIQVEVFRNGKTILATVCDAGPARTYKGKLLHNAIDLTYALAHELDTSGDATVTYRILKDGLPMEIKGWDFANNCEIAQAGIA